MNFEFHRRKLGFGRDQALNSSYSSYVLLPISPSLYFSSSCSRSKCLQLKRVIVRASSSSSTGSRRSSSSRRVYKESQAQPPTLPVDQIASFAVPAGAFVVISFGIHILPSFYLFGTEFVVC